MDCGDYVVVTNARNVKVTGKKAQQLVYRHHTMFPGGLKEIQYKEMMRRKPDEVCRIALNVETSTNALVFCRSSGKRFLACCRKTSCASGG